MDHDQSIWHRLLHIPLFYKILLANSAIVGLGAVIGTVVTVWHVQTFKEDIHYELIAFFSVGGVFVSYLVNQYVLKLALTPLDRLQDAVDEVARGDLSVRIDRPTIIDERFDRLVETFNSMLGQLERDAHQQQQLSRQILQAQEDERHRLARELHDEAAQALTSLLVQLRLLERAYKPEEAQQRVTELRELTAQALEDVRRVAIDLRPTILDDLGLVPALEWRVDEINKLGGLQASLSANGISSRLPRDVELVFYRIGQEALTNTMRHSRATKIQMALQQTSRHLSLEVVDNGVGFKQTERNEEPPSGLGLVGMRERIGMLGGTLVIESQPGQGCRIFIEADLPVEI